MAISRTTTKKLRVLVLTLTALVTVWLGASARLISQGDSVKKRVEALYASDAPLIVYRLKVSGRSVKLGDDFDADSDWLRNLSFRLKNVSNRTVVFAGMYLDFPETKTSGNEMAFPLQFGHNPQAPVRSGELARLLPDGLVEISFSDEEYLRLKNFLEQRHAITSIHKAQLRITTIYFEDGAIWNNGSWVRPDPANPKRLIPVND